MDFYKLHNGSDIRGVALPGVAGEEVNLTEEAITKISASFAIWLKKKLNKDKLRAGVGHDSRLSAETLKSYVINGLMGAGAEPVDCGLASTPSMFMSTVFKETGFDAGIMITASHLPFNRNGLKFFTKNGGLESNDIKEILGIANDVEINCVGNKNHIVEKFDIIEVYSGFLRDKIISEVGPGCPLKGLHIVLDASNGSGGFFASKVLGPLGADTSGSIFLEPDGNFPNHKPNPEDSEAMMFIKEAVLKNKADLGIIFDTDVDRAAVVFSNGSEINRNKIIALASAIVQKSHPNSIVVTDSVTSNHLTEFLESGLNLTHHRFKRGYKNVINEAIRLNEGGIKSYLAIETSGHCAFHENYFLDDGAYLSVKICIEAAKALQNNSKLEYLIQSLGEPKESFEYRVKINTGDFKAYGKKVLEGFEAFVDANPDFEQSNSYEGVRVLFDKGFLMLRMSLHDPQIAINIESDELGASGEVMLKIRKFIEGYNKLIWV
ncbi:MAG: phosphomannomutase/phosphoglucomutase [Clostridiales bacterium]|jgi:phosphomannomutase|nr:phosphomannomutase/phosphoglucomutase [Clostridiales bacterium]